MSLTVGPCSAPLASGDSWRHLTLSIELSAGWEGHGGRQRHRVDGGDLEPHDWMRPGVAWMRSLLCPDPRQAPEGNGRSQVSDRREPQDFGARIRSKDSPGLVGSALSLASAAVSLYQFDV